jgi:hypothetical protein
VAGGPRQQGKAAFSVTGNGKGAAKGQVTEDNADVLQQFDLTQHVRPGPNEVTVEVKGETGLMYQVVGRHFVPHKAEAPEKPVLEVVMGYDRTSLSTADVLRAKATVKYNGKGPTYLVLVGLPVPPGLTAGAGEFAELVGAKRVQKFGVTARQVTLYLGRVKPGSAQAFEYTLKPKYPVQAKAPGPAPLTAGGRPRPTSAAWPATAPPAPARTPRS